VLPLQENPRGEARPPRCMREDMFAPASTRDAFASSSARTEPQVLQASVRHLSVVVQ